MAAPGWILHHEGGRLHRSGARTVPIPYGMFPVAASNRGPILAGDGFAREPLEVWDPATQRPVQSFGSSPRGFPTRLPSFVAATPDRLIWEGGDCVPSGLRTR